jgi:hypothetical protein
LPKPSASFCRRVFRAAFSDSLKRVKKPLTAINAAEIMGHEYN